MGYLLKKCNQKIINVNNQSLSTEFIDFFCESLNWDIDELHVSNTNLNTGNSIKILNKLNI